MTQDPASPHAFSDRVLVGDCRAVLPTLPDGAFRCCVTSPPYWGLRDYGHAEQIGLESSPDAYVATLVGVFREVRRVLADDGTLWLNLGDTYAATTKGSGGTKSTTIGNGAGQATNAGSFHAECRWQIPPDLKPKDLVGIPWRVAFALQADGWYLRSDIVWAKPNPMPESVRDRPTKAHEYVFLLAKSERYFYDADAIAEDASGRASGRVSADKTGVGPGFEIRSGFASCGAKEWQSRNARSVWPIASRPYTGSHFATMPPALAERCVLAGSRHGDLVLDPFFGSGTVGEAAERLGRGWTGIELNAAYERLAAERTAQRGLRFAGGTQ